MEMLEQLWNIGCGQGDQCHDTVAQPAVRQIGKAWYMWMPKGAEKIEIVLPSE